LLETYSRDLDARREEYRADQSRIKSLGDEVARLDDELKALDRERRGLGELQRQEASLAQRVQAAQAAAEQAAAERVRLAALDAQIAQEDYALDEQAALKGVLAELAELGYDAAEHDRVRAWLVGLGPVELRWQDLQKALGGAAEIRERLAQARARATQVQVVLEEERRAQARVQVEVGRLQEALQGSEQREAEVGRLRETEALARQKFGAAQQKIDACDALVKTRENRSRERALVAAEQGMFQELVLACGKKGVPAMIIEAAIPEIEEAANELLARMTANRMHVQLETQREKVTGGIAETLDIKISDELGTRDYALYSGGEAFRVNFAVRIGLSRLLARRAGAQLQLLVLDEGFGALDAAGREQLIEAINAVKEDFQCVLVITHIEELRDVFPARIDVKKTDEGSLVQIV
jgi:exonuclease SbcC